MRVAPAQPSLVQRVDERKRSVVAGVWRLADPKISLASFVPFVVGTALAVDQLGSVSWGICLSAFAAIFLVEVGKNAVNDLCDYEADAALRPDERSPFSGGKRTLVDGLLARHDLALIAWVAFLLAGAVGLEVARRSNPLLLLLGAVAAAISVLYAMRPVRLSARGLGELAVLLVYGPGIVLGTLMFHGASLGIEPVLASVALGFLIANVLLINEVPDERVDALAGKRTLVVRLGRRNTPSLFTAAFVAAVAIPVGAAGYGWVPFRMTVFLVAVPLAVAACSMLRGTPAGPPVPAQAMTLLTYVATGIAYAATVLLT